jgi:hypothetical protein
MYNDFSIPATTYTIHSKYALDSKTISNISIGARTNAVSHVKNVLKLTNDPLMIIPLVQHQINIEDIRTVFNVNGSLNAFITQTSFFPDVCKDNTHLYVFTSDDTIADFSPASYDAKEYISILKADLAGTTTYSFLVQRDIDKILEKVSTINIHGGSAATNKVNVLGRLRNIHIKDKTKHVMYKKELIKLSDAKKLEKSKAKK